MLAWPSRSTALRERRAGRAGGRSSLFGFSILYLFAAVRGAARRARLRPLPAGLGVSRDGRTTGAAATPDADEQKRRRRSARLAIALDARRPRRAVLRRHDRASSGGSVAATGRCDEPMTAADPTIRRQRRTRASRSPASASSSAWSALAYRRGAALRPVLPGDRLRRHDRSVARAAPAAATRPRRSPSASTPMSRPASAGASGPSSARSTVKLGETDDSPSIRPTNRADRPITGIATFNVTPDAGRHLFRQDRSASASPSRRCSRARRVDMPVVFFVDPAIAEDPRRSTASTTITLSYTFFPRRRRGEPVAAATASGEPTLNETVTSCGDARSESRGTEHRWPRPTPRTTTTTSSTRARGRSSARSRLRHGGRRRPAGCTAPALLGCIARRRLPRRALHHDRLVARRHPRGEYAATTPASSSSTCATA